MRADVIQDAGVIDDLAEPWDALACARSRPFSAPAWLAAWWRHVAPPRATLRVVAVRERGELIGVAPFFLATGRLGLRTLHSLASATSQRVEPLAVLGRELDVAAAVAAALGGLRAPPDVVSFDGIDARSAWPGDLARAWPGGAAILDRYSVPSTAVCLRDVDGFDAWFAGRSARFRAGQNSSRNRFLRLGGRFRWATSETLDRDLRALVALHCSRWAGRGGSTLLDDQVHRMLLDAGRVLLPRRRFRLLSMQFGDEIVCSHLALSAGTEYAGWISGFDERYAKLSPSNLGLLSMIQDAFACGAERMDLAGGGVEWKRRFGEADGTLVWRRLVPCGPRPGRTRVVLSSVRLRRAVARRVPDSARARLTLVEQKVRGAAAPPRVARPDDPA